MPVIINNNIFVHLPKNAGTSITFWMCENLNAQRFKRKHDSFSATKKRFPNNDFNFSFAVVRNPWDRLVSAYFYNKRFYEGKYADIDEIIKRKANSKVVNQLLEIKKSKEIVSKSFEYFVKSQFYTPVEKTQTEMCEGVKHILFYENLKNDFTLIQNHFNVFTPLDLKNTSNHKQYQQYYNNDTIDIVYNYYKDDIKKWNYEF